MEGFIKGGNKNKYELAITPSKQLSLRVENKREEMEIKYILNENKKHFSIICY